MKAYKIYLILFIFLFSVSFQAFSQRRKKKRKKPEVSIKRTAKKIELGDSVTFSWDVRKSKSFYLRNNGQELPVSGSMCIKPDTTTIYRFISKRQTIYRFFTKKHKKVKKKNVKIIVLYPKIDEFICPGTISDGDDFELSWKTSNVNNVCIENYTNAISNNGCLKFKIDTTTTFTLTAKNKFGKKVTEKRTVFVFKKYYAGDNLTDQSDYTPKYNTIAHKMLCIEDSLRIKIPDYKIFPDFRTLDIMIDNSKIYIPQKKYYTRAELNEIAHNIYTDILTQFSDVYKKRDDVCYRNSLVFLAIGEANNLPFYGVVVPEYPVSHVVVRYDPDGKHNAMNINDPVNKDDVIIEATMGVIIPEIHYINTRNLKKGILLKNLTEDELFSTVYAIRGSLLHREKGEIKNTILLYNKALSLNPDFWIVYWTRGILWGSDKNPEKDYKKAIADFTKATELHEHYKLYALIAECYAFMNDSYNAIDNYTIAIAMTWNYIRKKALFELLEPELHDIAISHIQYLVKRATEYKKTGDIEEQLTDNLSAFYLYKALAETEEYYKNLNKINQLANK